MASMWADFDITGVPEVAAFLKEDDGILYSDKEPAMPFTPTLQLDPIGPVAPGAVARVTGTCLPAEGEGIVTVLLNLPAKPDGFAYAVDPFGFSPERAGRFEVFLQVPDFDAGAGIDASVNASAVIFFNGEYATASASTPLRVAAGEPRTGENPPPVTDPPGGGTEQDSGLPRLHTKQEEIDHIRVLVFDAAGDGFNRDQNPVWLDIQRAVNAMKEGKPFSSARTPR